MAFKSLEEIIELNKDKLNTVARISLAAAHDKHSLEAIKRAMDEGLVKPVLVGDKAQIMPILEELKIEVPEEDIYDEPVVAKACKKAVALINEGKADFLMKGKAETSDYLRAVVNKETGLGLGGTMSMFTAHATECYDRILVPVDGALVTYPTLEQKKDIIQNTVNAMLALGWECPKVGVVCCKEKTDPKMPETLDAAELKAMNQRGEITGCIVEGPISFDIATSKEDAKAKGFDSPCAGTCDILLAHDIHAGNIMGKMMSVLCKSKLGGFLVGSKCPIVFSSRGSSSEEKYLSICLAAIAAANMKKDA